MTTTTPDTTVRPLGRHIANNVCFGVLEHDYAAESQSVTMGCPIKLPLPAGQSSIPTTRLIHGPSRLTTPSGIQIQSAVLPQSTGQTHRHRQTDRWSRRQNLYQYSLSSVDYIATRLIILMSCGHWLFVGINPSLVAFLLGLQEATCHLLTGE